MTAGLNGRHVLFAILGFFAAVMAVNAVFVYFAASTFTGLEAPKAYRSGIAYNESLAAAAAQARLGWTPALRVDAEAPETAVALTLTDDGGRPLQGLVVNATWRRPTQAADDQAMALSPEGPGRYAGRIALPARGQWDLILVAEDARGHRFRLDRRLWIKP